MGVYRTLNKNGSLNISKKKRRFDISDSYHSVLAMPWATLLCYTFFIYIGINLIFGTLYFLCGVEGLASASTHSEGQRFLDDFFFSVQTFATIGYGHMTPATLGANIIVTFEALFGVISYALLTGIFFSRFSRPTARVIFSNNALIAEHDGVPSFIFRIANERLNQIIEAQIRVTLIKDEVTKEGERYRSLYDLALERSQTPLFSLSWTVVHAIDEQSPLYGLSRQDLINGQAEILATVSGVDETFSQPIYSRASYTANEILWNHRFVDILVRQNDKVIVDMDHIHSVIPLKENSVSIATSIDN